MLRHAMQRSQAENQVAAGDSHHRSVAKQHSQHRERVLIVLIAKGRHQNQPIRDVEIGIARGQALAVEIHRLGHLHASDLHIVSGSRAGMQALQILFKRLVIDVRFIRLDHRHNGVGGGEASQIVDVAMRVVACNASIQPDDFVDSMLF